MLKLAIGPKRTESEQVVQAKSFLVELVVVAKDTPIEAVRNGTKFTKASLIVGTWLLLL